MRTHKPFTTKTLHRSQSFLLQSVFGLQLHNESVDVFCRTLKVSLCQSTVQNEFTSTSWTLTGSSQARTSPSTERRLTPQRRLSGSTSAGRQATTHPPQLQRGKTQLNNPRHLWHGNDPLARTPGSKESRSMMLARKLAGDHYRTSEFVNQASGQFGKAFREGTF